MITEFKPLDFAGILDKTIKLFLMSSKSFLKLFFTFFAVINIIISSIFGIVVWYIFQTEGLLNKIKDMPFVMSDTYTQKLFFLIPASLVLLFIIIIISLMYNCMTYELYIKSFLNEGWDIKQSFKFSSQKIKPMFIASILLFLILIGGLLLCCIGTIPLTALLSLVFPILIFEGLSPTESIKKSFNLVKNDFWQILACILLMQMVLSFLSAFLQLFSYGFNIFIPHMTANMTTLNISIFIILSILFISFTVLISLLSTAFMTILNVVIYFNQKAKIEGFGKPSVEEIYGNSTSTYDNTNEDEDD